MAVGAMAISASEYLDLPGAFYHFSFLTVRLEEGCDAAIDDRNAGETQAPATLPKEGGMSMTER
jgi:hypothetical protein